MGLTAGNYRKCRSCGRFKKLDAFEGRARACRVCGALRHARLNGRDETVRLLQSLEPLDADLRAGLGPRWWVTLRNRLEEAA
jgi:hypothetical protein